MGFELTSDRQLGIHRFSYLSFGSTIQLLRALSRPEDNSHVPSCQSRDMPACLMLRGPMRLL